MPMWLRAVEFAANWAVFAGAAWLICTLAARTSRWTRAGVVARVVGSLVLGALGWVFGFIHVLTLGVIVAGDYRALLPSSGWCVWAAGAAAALLPWLVRGGERSHHPHAQQLTGAAPGAGPSDPAAPSTPAKE